MSGVWRDRLGLAVVAALMATPALAEEAAVTSEPVAGAAAAAPAASQAESATEEIIVTGSYIKGTPEDSALPVDVTTAADLQAFGDPNIIETVRNLAYTSGNLAETNQFGSSGGSGQGAEGVTSINLRGLGGARTLVLINGRRHVASETQGVDINVIPSAAIGRLEVLKDGAAALYGSDAIAGVVNMITREGFEGFEVRGSTQAIDESNGDHDAGFIFGGAGDNLNYFVAGEWQHRSELGFKDRDWGLIDYDKNPQGGWSGIGNPARYLPASPGTPTAGPEPGYSAPGSILGAGAVDPQCELLGGVATPPTCRFQYTYFDNITEDQDNYKAYGEVNFDLANGAEWHTEALYSKMNMDQWKTSPSYSPQSLFGRDRFIGPEHPGLIDMKLQNPTMFPDITIPGVGTIPGAAQGTYLVSRMIGVEGLDGKPQTGTRETEQRRLATSLTGTFADSIDYDFAVSYSERTRSLSGYDMYVERMAFALDGLGGPNCNPNTGTPGAGGCLYYNPFSNAIEKSSVNNVVNPQYNPAVDNPRELLDWLVGKQASEATNELLVFDAVLSGETPIDLGAGAIGWAAGFQARDESYDLNVNELTNLAESPCPFNNPRSIAIGNVTQSDFDRCQLNLTDPGNPNALTATGPLAFLAGTVEEKTSRTIYAFFTEFAIPVTDTFDVSAALRFEDFGGDVGSTVDPKVAFRWQALDWMALRGSASTTFRGPPQSFLSGRGTALVFIPAPNAFKAVDTLGNPDLRPEEAIATNIGLLFETGGLYASVDYWRYDFSDPFQTESSGQIVNAYQSPWLNDSSLTAGTTNTTNNFTCADPTAAQTNSPNHTSPYCQGIRAHVFPLGTTAAGLERVEVNIINGADIVTSGIDAYIQYAFEDVFGGELTVGAQATHTIEYDSDDFLDINGFQLAEGGDFVGFLNDGTAPFTPKPDTKGDIFLKYQNGIHQGTLVARYVADYEDALPPTAAGSGLAECCGNLDEIDELWTFDAHYILSLMEDRAIVSLSVINLTDEDPPLAATDLNYDPFSHDARGIIFKAGVKYTLYGG